MGRQILSIDIRNHLVAAVLLDTGLKANTVVACEQMAIKERDAEEDPLREAISQLLVNIPHENASIVVALPSDGNIYRNLTVPFKENNKIKQVLPFELEPDLPIPVEKLVIGFQKTIIGDQTHVMATAIERQNLERYTDLFAEFNIHPQLVIPGSFPAVIEFMVNAPEQAEQALFIEVDQEKATLYALIAGRICMVRSLPASIESETAVEQFALKIRQTLTAFADAHTIDFSPASVILHGPALNDPKAVDLLNEALALPTQPLDLHQRMNKVDVAYDLDLNPWIFDNALASACLHAEGLECLNFHRSGSSVRNFWAAYRPYIRTPAILLAVTIAIGLGGVIYDNAVLKGQLNDINEQANQIFKSTFIGTPLTKAPILDQMTSKLKEAKKNVATPIQAGNRIRSVDALLDISKRLPSSIDVTINRMVVSDDAITLSGVTGAFNVVDDIKGRIEKSDFFTKVTIASANTDKSGKNVRFKLKIEL